MDMYTDTNNQKGQCSVARIETAIIALPLHTETFEACSSVWCLDNPHNTRTSNFNRKAERLDQVPVSLNDGQQ